MTSTDRSAAPEPRYPYVHVDVPEPEAEAVSAELWEAGAEGVEERDVGTLNSPAITGKVTLVAYFPDEAEAHVVAKGFGRRFPARVELVIGDAWRDAWKAYFKPSRVGARLVVRPSWEEVKTWPDEVVLTIDPGRAFGSGIHETTRLVLKEIDRRIHGGETVLDIGCGSGILSIAAKKLGAKRARAIDNDPDTIPVVLENARANRVSVEASDTPIERIRGEYDLVVANIEARVLVPLARAIARTVAPRGTLVLSGILRGQESDVRAAYPDFDLVLVTAEGEWVALVLAPKARRKKRGAKRRS